MKNEFLDHLEKLCEGDRIAEIRLLLDDWDVGGCAIESGDPAASWASDCGYLMPAAIALPRLISALRLSLEALKYINRTRGKRCQSEKCTCNQDTAVEALAAIEKELGK